MHSVFCFAQTYTEARDLFVAAARARGLSVEHHPHPAMGPKGEALATEVVRVGPIDAPAVLWVGSATHGIEGFCGSGAQTALLRSDALDRLPAGVAVLLVHAHNPHGFAWGRRVTEDNVDLNRNFVADFADPPQNPGYAALHPHLVPGDWAGPGRKSAERAIAHMIDTQGFSTYQSAFTQGQYTHPDGLFFGGHRATWSHRTMRRIMRRHAAAAQRFALVDLHSGLGPTGYGEAIYPGGSEESGFARALQWYGPAVTCPADGTSTSAVVVGEVPEGMAAWLPAAEHTGIALEFGTVPLDEMLTAVRGDHFAHVREVLGSPLGDALKARMRAAFYVETDAWKVAVVDRTHEVIAQAIAGLAG
jgi:hypothetical protein